jgi:hypothetical protein
MFASYGTIFFLALSDGKNRNSVLVEHQKKLREEIMIKGTCTKFETQEIEIADLVQINEKQYYVPRNKEILRCIEKQPYKELK